jgi:hypothetical protein
MAGKLTAGKGLREQRAKRSIYQDFPLAVSLIYSHQVGTMDKDKEKQEISVIGRLFSLEALLIVMGLFSLASGIFTGDTVRLLLGAVILGSLALLIFTRKKGRK